MSFIIVKLGGVYKHLPTFSSTMKRLIFTALLFLFGLNYISAQDCPICGEWTSTFPVGMGEVTANRLHVLIRKAGDKYYVNVKTMRLLENGGEDPYYWNDCTVTQSNENSISWVSLSHIVTEDELDGDERINGKRIYSAKCFYVCSATVENGVLHFSRTIRCDCKGRDGNIIGYYRLTDMEEYDMFKDMNNW